MKFSYFGQFWKGFTNKVNTALERKLRATFHLFFDWMIILAKIFGLVLIVVLIRNINFEMRKDAYSIQTFHVPKHLEESGLNGLVLAQKIMDEVAAIKADVGDIKNDSVKFDAALKPEMDLSVMGVGFSTKTILYYAKQLLGKKDRTVSGELTNLAQDMTLTLRFSDANKIEVHNYTDSLAVDKRVDRLLKEAAEKVLRWSDPYILAVYYYHHSRFDEALDCARAILKERPKEAAWAYLAWGSILVRQQNINGGLEKYEKAVTLDSKLEPALSNLGMTYFHIGEYEKATKVLERLLTFAKVETIRSRTISTLAQCYVELKKFAKAEKAFEQVIKEFPKDIYNYGYYGNFKIKFKLDTAGALDLYRQGREQAPESAEGFLFLAGSLFYENRQDSALKMLYKVLEYDPNNVYALSQIVRTEFGKKNFEESLKMARKSISVFSKNKQETQEAKYYLQLMYNSAAVSHYSQLRYDSAVYYAQYSIAVDTNTAYPYTSLAESYAFMGQKEKFYLYVRKAVSKGFKYTPETVNQEPYIHFIDDMRFRKAAKYKPLKN